MNKEDMTAQPCVPLSTELACKELDTIAAPALLNLHKVVESLILLTLLLSQKSS
jgi:hypothetical protein